MAATAFNVDSFKSKLSGGGARPALFKVSWSGPSGKSMGLANNQHLLLKAASLPASNIAPLVQNYAGRAYKLQGFRTFDPWVVTIINDEDFWIRDKIKAWMQLLSGGMDGTRSVTSVSSGGEDDPEEIKLGDWSASGTATVTQISQTGEDLKMYKFYSLWPTELAPIPLDWSSDMVEEYSVTFAYDYWTTGTETSGTAKNQVGPGKPIVTSTAIAS